MVQAWQKAALQAADKVGENPPLDPVQGVAAAAIFSRPWSEQHVCLRCEKIRDRIENVVTIQAIAGRMRADDGPDPDRLPAAA